MRVIFIQLFSLVLVIANASAKSSTARSAFNEDVVFNLMVSGYLSEQIPQIDADLALNKLDRITMALADFNGFYLNGYYNYKGAERFSPAQIVQMIDRLTAIDRYLRLVKSQMATNELLTDGQKQKLETFSLKNQALINRLSLEFNNIEMAAKGDPQKLKDLFEGLNRKNVRSTDNALTELAQNIGRLNYMAQMCLSLF